MEWILNKFTSTLLPFIPVVKADDSEEQDPQVILRGVQNLNYVAFKVLEKLARNDYQKQSYYYRPSVKAKNVLHSLKNWKSAIQEYDLRRRQQKAAMKKW